MAHRIEMRDDGAELLAWALVEARRRRTSERCEPGTKASPSVASAGGRPLPPVARPAAAATSVPGPVHRPCVAPAAPLTDEWEAGAA